MHGRKLRSLARQILHASVPRAIMVAGAVVCLISFQTVFAQRPGADRASEKVAAKTRVAASRPDTARTKSSAEAFHAFLLIAERPLHVKFHFIVDQQTPSAALNDCVAELSQRLDKNKDGKLSREEFNKSPLVRRIIRKKASKFLNSLGPQPPVKHEEIRKQVWSAAGGSPVVIRTNTSTATYDAGIFEMLDTDASGRLEPKEMENAEQVLIKRDTDFDQVLAFDEFTQSTTTPTDFVTTTMQPATGATQSDLMILTTAITRLRAEFFKQYDKDRNRRLSADELNWPATLIQQLDLNDDQLLSSMELNNLSQMPVDIELQVAISTQPEGAKDFKANDGASNLPQSATDEKTATAHESLAKSPATISSVVSRATEIRVLRVAGEDAAKVETRSGVVSVNCHGVQLRLAVRPIDPIKSAIENAMQGFNQLDTDNNGYLGKDEVGQRVRMARGLFDMIDTDADEKIFAKEMTSYIEFAGAPMASTVRVDVYDTGYGFFQNLDANQDGRLSVRELRTVSDSLAKMERDNEPGLSTTEPIRNYYIEFVRGSFRLFGQRSQLVAPTAETGNTAFVRAAVSGPVWFQRMDRNNDGDLTWEEFLGPKSVFTQLDNDQDGLIDPKEAARAGVE